jgi:hypothetical protein
MGSTPASSCPLPNLNTALFLSLFVGIKPIRYYQIVFELHRARAGSNGKSLRKNH